MIFFGVDIKYNGAFKSEDQLPKGELPPSAVKTGGVTVINGAFNKRILCTFAITTFLFILFANVSCKLYNERDMWNLFNGYDIMIGFTLAWICTYPHEWLHAICYGKGAEVGVYNGGLFRYKFVYCTKAITKTRSIVLRLLPVLVLGWIPLIIWAITPLNGFIGHIVWFFSYCVFMGSAGDHYDVYNTLRQIPKGSMVQYSGLSTYWFMPKEQKDSTL